jgi:hypothetical protein
MTISPTSGQRPRPCRACGKKFDYPVKGSAATRQPLRSAAVPGRSNELTPGGFR